MADDAPGIDRIAFLARSETRVRTLELLAERDVASTRECRAALEASRSTVSRTLRGLADRDWIRERADGYEITPAGQVVADSFLELVDAVDATTRLAPFLRHFPCSEFDLDVAALRDAQLTVASDGDPYAPADRQTERLRSTAELRCLLPSAELEGCKLLDERCRRGDLAVESVVSPSVAETITGGEYASLLRETVEAGAHDVFRAAEPLPFYLGLAGSGEVEIGVECEDGFPRALLVTDDPSVREWGETVFAARRERAERLTAAEFDAA